MSGPKSTLLIVDDNEMNRDVLSRRLRHQGYDVVLAAGGREALELIAQQRFDLALFDIMMPEVSGLDALEIVRKTHSLADLPVIMVTAKHQSDDVIEALKRGANDYVTKPVDFPVLLARVRTHLALHQLSVLKDEFLNMASHDLKNPLTEILGVASLVESMVPPGTPMPESLHTLVVSMKLSARRMQYMIEDFLDFQAVEDGAMRLQLEPVDLNALATQVANSSRAYASSKDIVVNLALTSPLPLVEADPRRMVQVIQNYVDNAVKFSPRGAAITVSSRRDGSQVVLEVGDTGPGLQPEDFAQAFVKYAHLSNAPTGSEKSSGLGLAICKQLIERQAGKVGVFNNPERGATFWFALEAVHAQEPRSAPVGDVR